jgi:hypothetical protein
LFTEESESTDFKDGDLQTLIDGLIRQGFQPYLTSVGGSGLGILSPFPEHRTQGSDPHRSRQEAGQVTPPETPNPEIAEGYEKQSEFNPLRPSFEASVTTDLPQWAASLGRWLYV